MMRQTTLLLLAAVSLWAQGTGSPAWKEFSIGPAGRSGGRFSSEGIRGDGVPLKRVLAKTYGLPEHRIIGPEWLSDRFALTAVVSNPEDFQPLMQQELETRFQMVAHREKKEVAVYVLKAAEGVQPVSKPADSRSPSLRMSHATMTEFANALADVVQRPVFDETGISGSFEITLSWTMGNAASLRKALKEQLGVDLAEDRRSVELLMIDRIERPKFSK